MAIRYKKGDTIHGEQIVCICGKHIYKGFAPSGRHKRQRHVLERSAKCTINKELRFLTR